MGIVHDVASDTASWWLRRRTERSVTPGDDAPVVVRRDSVGGSRDSRGGASLEWMCRRRREPAADDAVPLVMVHGLGTSGASLVRPMLALGPSVDPWAPDLPGFGVTSTPEHALDLAELADGLVAWMDEVGLDQVAMMGHSLGCQVLTHVATRHPERVSRAVLVGPTLDPPARSVVRQVGRLALDGLREPVSELPWVAADYFRCGPARMLKTLRDALSADVEDRLREMHLPVLLVRGRGDPVAPQQWLDHAASLLPDASMAVLPGAHAVTYSHPGELAAAIEAFLNDEGATDRGQRIRRAARSAAAGPGRRWRCRP